MTGAETGPILVAVDFSPSAEAAFRWAAGAARAFGAPLIVLHVVHDPEGAPGAYQGPDQALQPLEQSARRMLDEFMQRTAPLRAGVHAADELVVGLPATRILEVADRENARLIVMGSRGRTGLKRILLGSKAERVVQLSPIPVTIVKAEE